MSMGQKADRMIDVMNRLVDILEGHFSVVVLLIMFFGGAFMLSHYGMHEETSRWIEASPTIVALVSILKQPSNGNGGTQVTESVTTATTINTKKE